MSKKKKIIYIFLFVIILLIAFLSLPRKKEKIQLKENYSLNEIITKIHQNYSKIKTVQMTFSDIWVNMMDKTNALITEVRNVKLYDSFEEDKFKIKVKELEFIKDKKSNIKGNYIKKQFKYNYKQLIYWKAIVYNIVLLLPTKIKDLVKDRKVHIKKMNKNGYYSLNIPPKNNDWRIYLVVNMHYGAIEEINIVRNLKYTGLEQTILFYPYTINAKLTDFNNFNKIYFPKNIKVRYLSYFTRYVFQSKLKKIKFNKKIIQKNLRLKINKETVWYSDPYLLNNHTLVMVKGVGKEIRDIHGKAKTYNKNFYIIKKNIKKNKEKIIKHLLFAKDKDTYTDFIFTADYNQKFNKLAYSIKKTPNNKNEKITNITGLYILNMKNNNTIKISKKGILPLWSTKGSFLIWNKQEEKNKKTGINSIWICDKEGNNKKKIINNGFHYNWGKDDKSIIFEKGMWAFGYGYYPLSLKKYYQIKKGIYIYQLETNKEEMIDENGFNPHVSQNRKKILYASLRPKNGIFITDTEHYKKLKFIPMESVNPTLNAYWSPNNKDIYFIKKSMRSISKNGLYKYNIYQDTYEFVSPEIKLKRGYFYDLIFSNDSQYLLYKLNYNSYSLYKTWGIYNLKTKKIK